MGQYNTFLIVSCRNLQCLPLAMNIFAPFISRLKLRRCAQLGSSPFVIGRIWVHGEGTLRIGNRVRLDASSVPIELYIGPSAEMILGDDVEIQGGASIEALQSVQIGDGCRIGERCKVLDNNFHQLGNRFEKPQSVPVVIEAGVTLEDGAIVLPGARVRSGSVVKCGAVVRGHPAAAAPTAEQGEEIGAPCTLQAVRQPINSAGQQGKR